MKSSVKKARQRVLIMKRLEDRNLVHVVGVNVTVIFKGWRGGGGGGRKRRAFGNGVMEEVEA